MRETCAVAVIGSKLRDLSCGEGLQGLLADRRSPGRSAWARFPPLPGALGGLSVGGRVKELRRGQVLVTIMRLCFSHFSHRNFPMSASHSSSRRSFLQAVAATSGAAVLTSAMPRAFGYQSANDRPVFCNDRASQSRAGRSPANRSSTPDFAALVDVDENVLAANVEKTEKAQNRKTGRLQGLSQSS